MNQQVLAIDVHAHYGVSVDQGFQLTDDFMTGDVNTVIDRAERAGVQYTLISPLTALFATNLDDILSANNHANKVASEHNELFHWVVVNPLMPDTYAQARDLLQSPHCIGIKIHPEQHCYKFSHEGEAIFAFASEIGAVVETHSGQSNSEPMDFVPFANAFPDVKLILSHLGNHSDNDVSQQVRAIQAIKNNNVYTDTSSSRSIYPNLLEWAVKEIGSDQILFGTDSPLYFAPMQRARIDCALLDEADKQNILRNNALRLFPKL